MSPPVRLLAPLLLAAAVVLASGCKSKGSTESASFVAIVKMPQNSLKGPVIPEEEIITQLKDRAKSLEIFAEINAGAASDARISILLFADHLENAQEQLRLLIKMTTLEVRRVHSQNRTLAKQVADGDSELPGGYQLFTYQFKNDDGQSFSEPLLLGERSAIESQHLARIWADESKPGVVQIVLSSSGRKSMEAFTTPMTEGIDRLAIVVDDEALATPIVRDSLSDIMVLSGIDPKRCRKIAATLQNPLEVPLTVESLDAMPAP